MRHHLLMVPAALVAAAPAMAESFLTVEKAQALLFPGATFTPADFVLSEAQVDQIIKASGATVFRSKVKAWKVSTGGWFFLDQVPGRDDRITYAIGLDKDGAVVAMEVMICETQYCGVRSQKWLGQFTGKAHTESDLATEITGISGTTLSADHITEGVKRMLATYALVVASKTG